MASRKRSLDDMSSAASGSKSFIDTDDYNIKVLRLAEDDTEDALDQRLAITAHDLGLDPLPMLKASALDGLTTSLSMTTIGSDSNKQSLTQSRMSQSTAPTSCSSSERQQVPQSPTLPAKSSIDPFESTGLADERRLSRHSFRASLRKMTGFKRRKSSVDHKNPPLASIDGNIASSLSRTPTRNGIKTPTSAKSHASSSMSNPSVGTSEEQSTIFDDPDAMKRTMESVEIRSLRTYQVEERARFLEYQRSCLGQLRAQHKVAQRRMSEAHAETVVEVEEKNALAADDLESRQLQAEVVFRQDLEAEKRTCLIRLRHMEAYCHSPSPPTTPKSNSSLTDDQFDRPLPERRVTDKDYHNLAAQYRERDNMDTLHKARIEVMQVDRKRLTMNLSKEREGARGFDCQSRTREDKFMMQCEKEVEILKENFRDRGVRLQSRWKLQAMVEISRLEKKTNLTYAPLPFLSLEDGK